MDMLPDFHKFVWCTKDWNLSELNEKEKDLLHQCKDIEPITLVDDIEAIIQNSKKFPIKFPIDTIRLEKLKEWKPLERLKRNIISTYPLIHERVLLLMAHFLIYKREHGSEIEKEFYKDMTILQLINRILKNRAISFVGPRDKYRLITGEKGCEGWEEIGTSNQKPPLLLENCLSYDELKISAMVYVSGYTECINDGERLNRGVVNEDNVEQEAVIIGLIGPRFHRRYKMDYEDILITKEQNIPENGYGEITKGFFDVLKKKVNIENQHAKKVLRDMWGKFYEASSISHKDAISKIKTENFNSEQYENKYIRVTKGKQTDIFDNEVYYKRICVLTETSLVEAEYRAKECGKYAFLNIIGCGLGVWMISGHQCDVYVLTFLERIKDFLENGLIDHVSDVNLAYIKASPNIEALFSNPKHQDDQFPNRKKIFLESEKHPNGGINIQMENRQPSSKLTGKDEGKLLVMTYPWDSNAHPGNEFWYGSLHTSGDPAAACSTQVAELHNAHINNGVKASNTRIMTKNGLKTIFEYCKLEELV